MRFFHRSGRVIIGIHGLCNKPERTLLEGWWELALREGVKRRRRLPFRMAYWAHHIYPEPLDPDEKDPESPRFLAEPYIPADPAMKHRGKRWLRRRALQVIERVLDWAFVSRQDPLKRYDFEELLLRRRFPDLAAYYSGAPDALDPGKPARLAIQEELQSLLGKHRDDRVMLIAHSMGSIIAHDVLSRYEDVRIDYLITLGSPLGLATVLKRASSPPVVREGRLYGRTPDTIRCGWYNYADIEDRVALDYTLGDDYLPNRHGVRPVDVDVVNDYRSPEGPNHHKSYGYLRSRGVAERVAEFLGDEEHPRAGLIARVLRRLGWGG